MTIDALPLGEVKLEIPIKGIPTHDRDLHLANHKVDTVQKLVDEQEWKVKTHKMADDVHEEIENALNTIATTTERSGNMKKELKHTIYETVSTLWKLFVKLKDM
jgi:outer membrane biogenesis lipoprotein LolB